MGQLPRRRHRSPRHRLRDAREHRGASQRDVRPQGHRRRLHGLRHRHPAGGRGRRLPQHTRPDRRQRLPLQARHGYGPASPNVDFFNNIVRDARSFLEIATGEVEGFASDHNLFWSSDGNQNRFAIGPAQNLSSWQAKQDGTSVLLADRNSRVSDPLFVPGAGTTDDYYTQSGSPARDRALDNTGAIYSVPAPTSGSAKPTTLQTRKSLRYRNRRRRVAGRGVQRSVRPVHRHARRDAAGGDVAAAVGLSKGTAQAWTGMAAIVLFDDVSGHIKARDGSAYTAVTAIPYQAHATYRVRFVVDVPARRYSAYVTPPGGAEITIGTNLAFRTEQQTLTSLDTRTVAAGIGSLQACSLQISATPDPSPSTTTVFALGDGADGSTASRALANYIGAEPRPLLLPRRRLCHRHRGRVRAQLRARSTARSATGPIPSSATTSTTTAAAATTRTGSNKRGWTRSRRSTARTSTSEGWQIIAYSSENDMDAEARLGRRRGRQASRHLPHRHRAQGPPRRDGHRTRRQHEPGGRSGPIANKTAINLVGHNHIYGRLAPIDGVTVIVSGAGKAGLRAFGSQHHTVAAGENGVPPPPSSCCAKAQRTSRRSTRTAPSTTRARSHARSAEHGPSQSEGCHTGCEPV